MSLRTTARGDAVTVDASPADDTGSRRLIAAGRRSRTRRRRVVVGSLLLLVVGVYALSLMVGQTFYYPYDVYRVLIGVDLPGASYAVGELRLPRATLALLTGIAFGLAGVTFQTMLRNALASPDVIGISAGASAAAIVGILVLGLSAGQVSAFATVAAVLTAGLIYLLAFKGGAASTRLILVGIGMAAMLESVVSYVISRAAEWDLQIAMRWLTGSLNDATWSQVLPLSVAMLVLVPLLLGQAGNLETLRLGDEAAAALGVPVERTRVLLILGAVGLIAFATAAAGPIAFVAFLSGPIASRILGPVGSPLLPAACVGALLVMSSDLVAQYAFDTRYPVGVVTGVLGAPYLIYLLVRTNRAGGSL